MKLSVPSRHAFRPFWNSLLIRYNLKELIEKKSLQEGRKVSGAEIAREIGIQRSAMAKMIRDEGYTTTTKTLDSLCRYFGCRIEELVTYEDQGG
ncbi:helix-turn-helix transcriptional regulator [Vibrio metschnikovii]|uniref:helix-turn-helix domain-containing protein n=1 Tax=Vibrio metschnikovii TaxID=28172 RepID=UPI002FC5B4B3